MPPSDSRQWIQIKDFRPGIADNPGATYPPGQAQRALTYRCIADRAGALVPLPQGVNLVNMPEGEASVAAVNGLYLPPIQVASTSGTPALFPPHELVVGDEIVFGGQRFQNLQRFRRDIAGYPADQITRQVYTDTSSAVATTGGFRPNGMSFGTTRSLRANPTTPGVPVVMANWWAGVGEGYLLEFPDDANPGSQTPYFVYLNNNWILSICCHQARTVIDKITSHSHGANALSVLSETVAWSALGDVTEANFSNHIPPSNTDIIWVVEDPSGLAFMYSMSANELFAVKQASGGVYVSGDLNYSTNVSLPLVTGSDIPHTPVASDLGVIYGSRSSGVWAWSSGDNSNLLSPQMDPLFWTLEPSIATGQDDFASVAYQFARSDDWILTPNNFLYDTQLKSWWRLEDPTVASFRFMAANFRFIYGAHSWYTATANPPSGALQWPIFFYDRNNLADTYSWQSQPLWETIDTLVDIREITMRVKGVGSVTVELRGESNFTSPISVTVNFSAPAPTLIRTPVRIQDSNIAVRLISTVSGFGSAAPTIYECNLGFVEAQIERTS